MNAFLTALDEPVAVKNLKAKMADKSSLLTVLLDHLESVKLELSLLKREYNARTGPLYLQLELLQIKFLEQKKTEELVHEGLSESEAKKQAEEFFKEQFEHIHAEFEGYKEEKSRLEKRQELSEEVKKELRAIWKKLASRFHPDFAKDDQERMQFEQIMKSVNSAYADGDLDTLRMIEQEQKVESEQKSTSLEELEIQLEGLEESIENAQREQVRIENSEWFAWKVRYQRALRIGRDLLAELEDKLRLEIKEKEKQLEKYK